MAGNVNRVGIVTGGASGLGAGIAAVLAQRGISVAVADVNMDGSQKVAAKLAADGGRASAFQVDVTSRKSVDSMVGGVVKEFGRVDILVTSAGVYAAPGFLENGFTSADWDMTFDVNVKGTVECIESVVDCMAGQGGGKVVTISSHGGRLGGGRGGGNSDSVYTGAYGASKAAVIHLTQTYAARLARHNINVNCICPGSIYTPLWEGLGAQAARTNPAYAGLTSEQVYEKWIKDKCPLGRPQTAEDIGKAVAFFASDDAINITGQSLNVNGGQRMD